MYYQQILSALSPLVNDFESLPDNIRDNLCVTIGRLCLVIPQEMTPTLQVSYPDICEAIATLEYILDFCGKSIM